MDYDRALWLFVFAAGVGSVTGVDPGLNNPYPIQNVNYFEYIKCLDSKHLLVKCCSQKLLHS